jgi:hypothetical protein
MVRVRLCSLVSGEDDLVVEARILIKHLLSLAREQKQRGVQRRALDVAPLKGGEPENKGMRNMFHA